MPVGIRATVEGTRIVADMRLAEPTRTERIAEDMRLAEPTRTAERTRTGLVTGTGSSIVISIIPGITLTPGITILGLIPPYVSECPTAWTLVLPHSPPR